MQLLAVSN